MDDQHKQEIISQAAHAAKNGVVRGLGGPFGASVFHTTNGEVIASGCNRVLVDHDPTAHAEVTAIRQACRELGTENLAGYSLYATGQPCPMCLAAIHWARLDAYFYTTTYAEAAAIGFDDAAIRDSMQGIGPVLVPVAQWEDEEFRRFFLDYGGKRY